MDRKSDLVVIFIVPHDDCLLFAAVQFSFKVARLRTVTHASHFSDIMLGLWYMLA